MADGYAELLDHTCAIYHVRRDEDDPVGFGIKKGTPVFSYPAEPDETGVPCHFNLRGMSTKFGEEKPKTEHDERTKVNFLLGQDVQLNDKIVHLETGIEYTAELPRNVRDHHTIVFVRRTGEQRPV